MSAMWGSVVDAEIDHLVRELSCEYPCSEVSLREVLDDGGVVAVLVTAGTGRLVVAARTVEFVPVEWGLAGRVHDCVGVLPRHQFPTVAEVAAGLEVVS